jgi:hypothetical protein
LVGLDRGVEGEVAFGAIAAPSAAAARLGRVGEGGEEGRGEGGRVAGGDEPACLTVDNQLVGALDAGGDDRKAGGHRLEHGVRHSFPEGGEDEQVGRLEEAGNVVATADRLDASVRMGGDPGVDARALGAVADEEEGGGRVRGQDAGPGVEEGCQALLRVEAADEEDEAVGWREAEGEARGGAGAVDAREIDSVGDDGQAAGVEAASIDGEAADALGDANGAAGAALGEAVEPEMPTALALGDAKAAEEPGTAASRRGEARGDVGVEQEALDEARANGREGGPKAADRGERTAAIDAEAGGGDVGGAELGGEGALGHECDHGTIPAAPVEAGGELDEGPLGAADIEVRDDEGDGNGAVGPGGTAGGGKARRKGIHRYRCEGLVARSQ